MTNLKKNIDHYMEIKGIKMYSHLLFNVAQQLGIRGEEAYKFVEKEKANFSKMLKGERPLKHEFIIPLEKIFGVSLARIMDENAYKLPLEKENLPFVKGFRYYAYLDDPELYRNEFNTLLAKDGKSILNNVDEFGKTFLDYVVEYQAVNGVRYLYEEYGMSFKWYGKRFDFNRGKGCILCDSQREIALARLVASMNDVDLFNNVFDSYNMFYTNGHYGSEKSLFNSEEYLEILLDNSIIFHSLFKFKRYELQLGNISKRKYGKETKTYFSFNPILNNCLNYAIKHLDRYKEQAIEILKFGIENNKRIASLTDIGSCYPWGELGGIKSSKNDDFHECAIIVNDNVTEGNDIKKLISALHVFNS